MYFYLDGNHEYWLTIPSALAGITLSFSQHQLDLIQVDSVDAQGSQRQKVNSAGILYPGQRMDVVLRSSPLSSNQSYMTVQLDQE
jgi:hypothetical protein